MKRLLILLAASLGLNSLLLADGSVVNLGMNTGPVLSPGPVISAPTKPAPAVVPAQAPTTPAGKSIADQMADMQSAAIASMSNLAADGVKSITQHGQTTLDGMNITQKQALASPKLGDLPNLQTYLDQLTSFANTGQKSLANLSSDLKNQITSTATAAAAKIMTLAGSDSTNLIIASTDNSSLNMQAMNYTGQIDRASSQATNDINSLLVATEATINDAYKAAKDKHSANMGKDALDSLITGITGTVTTTATALGLYYAKQIGCKFGIGICPPVDADTEALIKRFKLPSNIDELLEKVGCKGISDLLGKSAKTLEGLKTELAEKLGLAQDKLNELITKAAKAAGASDADITKLLEKVGDIQKQVSDALPQAKIDDILKQIGSKLSEATGTEIDVNGIVNSVKANLSAGKSASNSPASDVPAGTEPATDSGNGGINMGGAGSSGVSYENSRFFKSLGSESQANLRQTMMQELQSQRLSMRDFQGQIAALQVEAEKASGAAQAELNEQIKTANEIVEQAKSGELPPEEDPFVE